MAERVREDSASLDEVVEQDTTAVISTQSGVPTSPLPPGEKDAPRLNDEEQKELTQHENDYSEAPIPSVQLFSAGKASLSAGMRLIPQHKIEWCLVIPSILLVISITVSLACDELSVGEKKYYSDSYSSIKSTHYQCNWNRQRVSEHRNGGEIQSETIRYSEDTCKDYYGNNRCKTMERIGTVWLAMNITCLTMSFFSTMLVYKQGKRSLVFLISSLLCILFTMIATFNYMSNQQCSKINNISETSDSKVTNDIGASIIMDLVTMALATVCSVFSLVVNFCPGLDPRN